MADLLCGRRRFRQRSDRKGGSIDALTGCHQRPALWVMEFEIEVGHGDATVGIPGAACAHVKQSGGGFRQHLTTIGKAQLDALSGLNGRGENDGYEVITVPGKLRALDGGIMNEFDGLTVGQNFLDMKESCQLEHHGSLPSLPYL